MIRRRGSRGRRASDTRIAIIGAGGTGTCTALELASRGHRVELFERRAEAVSEASFVNEGKVHLGFIYALDTRLRTAARMIEGALHFADDLRRWIPFRAEDVVSTPFYYCVHRGSLLDPDALASHYERCCAIYREKAAASGLDYLGLGTGSMVARLKREEYAELVDPTFFTAVFRTTERAVDPRLIAAALRAALRAEPRIAFRSRQRVLGVREVRGGYRLTIDDGGARIEETFSDVVNAAWYQRLAIDRPLGIVPPAKWSHRYKFGNRVRVALRADAVPSCTLVQGPFGDIVNFGRNGLFLSWYPIGRTGMSTDEVPPDWHGAYSKAERHDVFRRSFAELRKRCARLDSLPAAEEEHVDPAGGVIYALGTTDVDDEDSRLHGRFEIGIQSRGRYHSVDTGKYTLVPWWGVRVADRVEGIDR